MWAVLGDLGEDFRNLALLWMLQCSQNCVAGIEQTIKNAPQGSLYFYRRARYRGRSRSKHTEPEVPSVFIPKMQVPSSGSS